MATEQHYVNIPVAVILDDHAVANIILAVRQKGGTVPESVQELVDAGRFQKAASDFTDDGYDVLDGELFFDKGEAFDILYGKELNADYFCEFYGDVVYLDADGNPTDRHRTLSSAELLVFLPSRQPAMFQTAYASMDELVREIRNALEGYLPEDFDLLSRVVSVEGTNWS